MVHKMFGCANISSLGHVNCMNAFTNIRISSTFWITIAVQNLLKLLRPPTSFEEEALCQELLVNVSIVPNCVEPITARFILLYTL